MSFKVGKKFTQETVANRKTINNCFTCVNHNLGFTMIECGKFSTDIILKTKTIYIAVFYKADCDIAVYINKMHQIQ